VQDGVTGLHIAAKYGHMEVVRLLMDRGASVDAAMQVRKALARALSLPDSPGPPRLRLSHQHTARQKDLAAILRI
jgi:ankyrin repeat protein